MKDSLIALSKDALSSLRDLAPIVLVIAIFQVFVIQQPVEGIASILFGGLLVVAGLTFFIFGLRIALFPIGEQLAHSLARKGSAFWLFTFAFVLGFGTVLSFNAWKDWRPLAGFERFADFGYFEILDYVTANLMMPITGLLLALFVGWRIKPEAIADQLQIENPAVFRAWFWLLRWVVPISIALILVTGL